MKRRDLTLMLGVVAALTALGCEQRKPAGESAAAAPASASAEPKAGAATVPGVTDTTIKIGSWGPLSGPAAAWGAVIQGAEAYFAYVNDKGGVHGRKIEFVYRDDQYNPSKTPALVRELVERERVFAMVAGIGTANGRAVADYLEQNDVPFFSPSSGDRFWSEGGKRNVYTAFPKYVTEGEILGGYAVKTLEKKKIGVLFQDDDFGKQGVEGVKAGVSKAGGEVVVEVSCLPTDTDLSGQVSQIVEKAPDVLVIYAGPRQAVPAVKMLEAQQKKPQIITSFVLSDPIIIKMAGDTWEGTIASSAGALPTASEPSAKLYRDILAKYGKKDASGKPPPVGNFTLAGFQFSVPLVEAMHQAGKDLTREKLYEAFESFQGWTGPGLYFEGEGLGPPLTFSKTQRLGNEKIRLVTAKGGDWETLTDWLTAGG